MNGARTIDAESYTRRDIERPPASVISEASAIGSATLHEASGRQGALPAQIRPVAQQFTVCGPAVTVHSPGGDNLWLHRALYVAEAGDVLVVFCSEVYEYGYWGEIMSTAARARHLGGLIIDACVRDAALLRQIGFPVFARGLCIRGTGKDFGARGWINHPLLIGDVIVQPGDLVVGDEDGVVSVPRAGLEAAVAASHLREQDEARIIDALNGGARTLDLYGWSHRR